MSATFGYIQAAAQLGLSAVLIRPKRSIGAFVAQVTIEEQHEDSLEITDHPVEMGAVISDHAFKLPARVTIRAAWSNSPSRAGVVDGLVGAVTGTIAQVGAILSGNSASQVRDIYEKLRALQSSAVPFDVYTGKRKYTDMLIQSLQTTTDKNTENILMVTVTCRQVIMVRTSVAVVGTDMEKQANPSATAPPTNAGTKSLLPGATFSNAGAGRGFVNPPLVNP